MKAVLISIQPKWCELIANGKKTIEVRKTRPKLETPFKCYIYCTQNEFLARKADGEFWHTKRNSLIMPIGSNQWSGYVIGKFVCDSIEYVNAECSDSGIDLFYHDCEKYGCLTQREVEEYFGVYDEEYRTDLRDMKGNGYAWHISDLKIYDKPKELGEFKHQNFCYKEGDYDKLACWEGICEFYSLGDCDGRYSPLTRPPQSWCYVDTIKGDSR